MGVTITIEYDGFVVMEDSRGQRGRSGGHEHSPCSTRKLRTAPVYVIIKNIDINVTLTD